MPERWREQLGKLDGAGPSSDLLGRARAEGSHGAPPEGPRPASRVIAGVVAFAVFGAAGLFAFNALRESPAPSIGPKSPASTFQAFWPETSYDAGAAVQAQVDSAPSGPDAWRTDPASTALRFAKDYLGWEDAQVTGKPADTGGDVVLTVASLASTAPCPTPGCPPEMQYRTEVITLRTLVSDGPNAIYSVVAVFNPAIRFDAIAGQYLPEGTTVSGHVERVEGTTPAFFVRSSSESGLGGVDCLNSRAEVGSSPGDFTIPIRFAEQPSVPVCDPSVSEYLTGTLFIDDPSSDTGASSTIYVMTAVPFFIQPVDATTPPTTQTYTDPLGWSIDYPDGWSVQQINTRDRVTTEGAIFANVPAALPSSNPATPSPVGPDPGSLPSNAVVVTITHIDGGPMPDLRADDSTLPLSAHSLVYNWGPDDNSQMSFRANGLSYELQMTTGSAPDRVAVDMAKAMIATIRVPSLRAGTLSGPYGVMKTADAYPVGTGTVVDYAWMPPSLVVSAPKAAFALELDLAAFPGIENWSWDDAARQVVYRDASGTEARWSWDGQPVTRGLWITLLFHPLPKTWDGHLLFSPTRLIGVAESTYWP